MVLRSLSSPAKEAPSLGRQIHGPEAKGSCESAPRMCYCQRVNSVAEQTQSACLMGQLISHPTKSGFSRRRDRAFRIRRETARPCEAIR